MVSCTICHLDIANPGVKPSFMRRLKATFHLSFNCSKVETPFDRLPFRQSVVWLIMVSDSRGYCISDTIIKSSFVRWLLSTFHGSINGLKMDIPVPNWLLSRQSISWPSTVSYIWIASRHNWYRYEVKLWRAIGTITPSLIKLLDDGYLYVRSAASRTIDKFAEHGELPLDCNPTKLIWCKCEVELWRAIGVIPSFVKLLESGNSDARLNTLSLLSKLANHGELVVVYCQDNANSNMKPSFAR